MSDNIPSEPDLQLWMDKIHPIGGAVLFRIIAERDAAREALQGVIDTPDHPMRKKCKDIAREGMAKSGATDRQAPDGTTSCADCGVAMVRNGDGLKCLNCGNEA